MKKFNPLQIALLLPVAYLLHLFDEYFFGFPLWFSEILKANLSKNDFIVINSIGFALVLIVAILYNLKLINNFLLAVIGTIFFINGIVHVSASILTITYSPGTITGIFFYIPMGIAVFKIIFPLLEEQRRFYSIIAAITVQIFIAILALNIC